VSVGAVPAAERDGGPSAADRLVLAFDVGGTKIAAGVVDGSGRVHSFVVARSADVARDGALDRLFDLGGRALAEAGVDASGFEAVGIACGGPLDAVRGTVSPVHLPTWRDVPIVALAEERYGRPAALENDATAAAAGEHRYGAGVGTHTMIYLTLSTGVGGGVVVDGRLHRGTTGNGGELGHVTVDWHGRVCRGCGRRGCLEAYVSGTSIAERAREAGLGDVTAADVADAAMSGNGAAAAVWAETIEALACGLISLVNAFEPERVVLGGGVMRSGDRLLGPVRERVRADAMGGAGVAAEIVAAALGDRVGVVGAATIAFDRVEGGVAVDG
jgi:glucokinase